MMRMSRIWETSPGSGVKSAGGRGRTRPAASRARAWPTGVSRVLLGVSESQDTRPLPERQQPAYFLSFLIARSHGDCGVRTDRDAAGAGGAHLVPRGAPCAARRLDGGARSAAARTGPGDVAPPVRGNGRRGAAARGVRRAGEPHRARAAAVLPP